MCLLFSLELIFNTKMANTTLEHITKNNMSEMTGKKRKETVDTDVC